MDKIICLGKNYLEHAKELGDAVPELPVIFFKPGSALISSKNQKESISAPMPWHQGAIHHEAEVVLKLKNGGPMNSRMQAFTAIDSITLGLDMTLRDIQANLKKNGHPWEIAKAFKNSAIVGPWKTFDPKMGLLEEDFTFWINEELKQRGNLKDLRIDLADSLLYISKHVELCEGDLVFTGTPAGVGPIKQGDQGELKWGNESMLRMTFTAF